jgi:hypothetical protein
MAVETQATPERAVPDDVAPVPIWDRPARLGYQETVRGMGGIVTPLLAGFCLATIATIVAADNPPKLAGGAVLALGAAAGLLLYSMQVAFMALENDPSPEQMLMWYPEGTVNKKSLGDIRARQAQAMAQVRIYVYRHSITYELGMLLFLTGLFLVIWPRSASFPRVTALIVVAGAIAMEVWWMVARYRNSSRDDRIERLARHPAGPHVYPGAVPPPTPTGLAGVLDPDRRKEAKLNGFPDLSQGRGATGR